MAVGRTTYGRIVAHIYLLFSTMHLKELRTIPQRSVKIVTSITLNTKQWISQKDCSHQATTEMLSPPPTPLGLSCTDSNFALATANVETRMTGSSLAQLC